MVKVNSLLALRLKSATEKLSKMTGLVERSSSGNLSSFSGVFRVAPLNEKENEALVSLLEQYKNETQEIKEDLFQLSTLTAEVKAINNQAIILHGERIKKAQEILKNYRDGAFSAWLIATYGNRQTPYNFLQYYELYKALPEHLHSKIDEMPRQAVYSLASREGNPQQKEQIVKNYSGQPETGIAQTDPRNIPLGCWRPPSSRSRRSGAFPAEENLYSARLHLIYSPSQTKKRTTSCFKRAQNEYRAKN